MKNALKGLAFLVLGVAAAFAIGEQVGLAEPKGFVCADGKGPAWGYSDLFGVVDGALLGGRQLDTAEEAVADFLANDLRRTDGRLLGQAMRDTARPNVFLLGPSGRAVADRWEAEIYVAQFGSIFVVEGGDFCAEYETVERGS